MKYRCVIADKTLIIKKFNLEIEKHHNSKMWKNLNKLL